jgi:predicted GH43/DUF377 family glycosyl hydrolase
MWRLILAIVFSLMASRAWAQAASWELGPWTRASNTPVIRPNAAAVFRDPVKGELVHWEALNTFNPAVVVRDGKVFVLYRAEDNTGKMGIGQHVSRLGLAVSVDGVHFHQMPEPVFYPAKDAQVAREAAGGVEDPRIVETENGTYVLTYTQWSRTLGRYSVGIATSRDLLTWVKHGPAFEGASGGAYDRFKYKSAGILTELKGGRLIAAKLKGKYWMYWGEIQVGLATSDDLIHWKPVESAPGRPVVLLQKREGLSDSGFPETGAPPVLTKHGIVLRTVPGETARCGQTRIQCRRRCFPQTIRLSCWREPRSRCLRQCCRLSVRGSLPRAPRSLKGWSGFATCGGCITGARIRMSGWRPRRDDTGGAGSSARIIFKTLLVIFLSLGLAA